MSQQTTAPADLRLERDPVQGVSRLFRGDHLAPLGAVLVRPAPAGMVREIWVQVANPLQAEDPYACCYLYNWAEDTWTVRDDRFQCQGNLHAAFVPGDVLAASQGHAPAPEPAAAAPQPANGVTSPPPEATPPPPDTSAAPADEACRIQGHRYWIESVAFAPDGRCVLSGSGQPVGVGQSDFDFTVRLWEVEGGKEVRGFQGHTSWVTSVKFSPDGRYVLSGSYDHSVRLWDVESGRELRRFDGHTDRVRSVALAPDGRRVLSGGYDKTVRLWHAERGEELLRFKGHEHWVMSVAFSPDGRLAASGGYDKTVRLWSCDKGSWFGALRPLGHVPAGRELHCLRGHGHSVTGVAFLPDGRHLLSGGMDKTLRLWDVRTGKEVRRFEGHRMGVTGLAVSADGRLALSSSLDETLRLWEVESGREAHCFRGHGDVVTSAAFSPDGQLAVSGSADRTVRVWRLPGG